MANFRKILSIFFAINFALSFATPPTTQISSTSRSSANVTDRLSSAPTVGNLVKRDGRGFKRRFWIENIAKVVVWITQNPSIFPALANAAFPRGLTFHPKFQQRHLNADFAKHRAMLGDVDLSTYIASAAVGFVVESVFMDAVTKNLAVKLVSNGNIALENYVGKGGSSSNVKKTITILAIFVKGVWEVIHFECFGSDNNGRELKSETCQNDDLYDLNYDRTPVDGSGDPLESWVLHEDQILTAGKCLQGPRKRMQLCMQNDCNLVLYDYETVLWSSNTMGKDTVGSCNAVMQADGNLAVYGGGPKLNPVIWSSNTLRPFDMGPFRASLSGLGVLQLLREENGRTYTDRNFPN